MTAQPENAGYLTVGAGYRVYYQTVGSGSRLLLVPNGPILLEPFRRLAKNRTIVFYDVRNRGLSDPVEDPAYLARGIHHDVDDIEAIRRHLGADTVDLIGHSYLGLMVVLYAMKYPSRAGRVVQIGPQQPDARKIYPRELTGADYVLAETFAAIVQLDKDLAAADAVERCRKLWEALRRIYVVNAADVGKLDWMRCELANERNFRDYWVKHLMPSIQALRLGPEDYAKAIAPVLTVHGRCDRAAPYGGARDWTMALPNARLLLLENAGHAPWIEAPEVLDAIAMFLDGEWPPGAQPVSG